RGGLGELGRWRRFGSGVMSREAAPLPERHLPWTFVGRRLAAMGVSGRALVVLVPAAWLTLFFLVPLGIVFGISLSTKEFGQPPYSDLLTLSEGMVQLTLNLSNYLFLLSDSLYINAYLNSIKIAFISTL